jgi:predicted RNA binding protein YcfA (HicA-like mRNA interferase family)
MKIARDVSGKDLANTSCRRWQYKKVHQVGSHIILETSEPAHQRIAIPDHQPLRLGTLSSILRTVAQHKGVTREEIVESL